MGKMPDDLCTIRGDIADESCQYYPCKTCIKLRLQKSIESSLKKNGHKIIKREKAREYHKNKWRQGWK